MGLPILYIGNKNYSSWSLRPWLAMRWAGIPFEERLVQLSDGSIPGQGAVSPSKRVPALHIGEVVVWDSLAIVEWAAEQRPDKLWPIDPSARAVARSVVSEMHSSFSALRTHLPMNVRRRTEPRATWPDSVHADIARVQEVWADARGRFGASGPFLFGEKSAVDAFFAPVCTRFRTYGVALPAPAAAYCEAIFADPDFKEWERAAIEEPTALASTDAA